MQSQPRRQRPHQTIDLHREFTRPRPTGPAVRATVVSAMGAVLLAACGAGTATTRPASAAASVGAAARPSALTPVAGNVATTAAQPASAATTAQPTSPRPHACTNTQGWTTGTMLASPMSRAEVYNVRAGQHPCFDRVVFDVNGPAQVGYTARYVSMVQSDAKGEPVPVAGGAALAVGLHAPDFGSANAGHQPWRTPWTVGQVLANTPGWASLRQVKFAGGFEGYSQYAVGVRHKLPFHFTIWTDSNRITHVIVDIAHP